MKAIHWLFPLTLVGAICPDYAIWVSHDRTPVEETIGRALPDLDFEKLKALNPWYITGGEPQPGRIYKIPYDESMTIVPPASWSGSCPKTLVLDSDRKDAETHSWLRRNPIGMRARDHEAASSPMIMVARSKESGDDAKETQASTATGTVTSTATEAAGTEGILHCREKDSAVEDFDRSLEQRFEFVKTFCNGIRGSDLTPEQPIKTELYFDTLMGVTLLKDCHKRDFGSNQVLDCLEYMKNISENCPRAGGSYRTPCLFYYFFKRDDHASSTTTPSATTTPS